MVQWLLHHVRIATLNVRIQPEENTERGNTNLFVIWQTGKRNHRHRIERLTITKKDAADLTLLLHRMS